MNGKIGLDLSPVTIGNMRNVFRLLLCLARGVRERAKLDPAASVSSVLYPE